MCGGPAEPAGGAGRRVEGTRRPGRIRPGRRPRRGRRGRARPPPRFAETRIPRTSVDDLDDHEGRDDGVGDRRGDRDELGHDLAGVAVDQALSTPAWIGARREDAGRDGAEDAADAVDGEDVERVVDLERARGGASRCSTGRRPTRPMTIAPPGGHEAGRRRDRDEAGDGAARRADDADLAVVEVARADPGERRRRGRRVGDDEARWRRGRRRSAPSRR